MMRFRAMRLYETVTAATTRFGYDGVNLVGEYNGSNTLLRRYVHGVGADEPLVWYEGSGTTDRRFLHTDERGSVIATSNSSGTVTATNAYDEYGIPKSTNTGRQVLGRVRIHIDWDTATGHPSYVPAVPPGLPSAGPYKPIDVIPADQRHPGNQTDVYRYSSQQQAFASTRTVIGRAEIPANNVGVTCPK